MAISAIQIRSGMTIKYQSEVWQVLKIQHRTPGNKRGFMQTVLRNVKSGNQSEVKFGSSESVDEVRIESRSMQYLYQEGDGFVFMDTENFEQMTLSDDLLKDSMLMILPEAVVKVDFYEGQAIGVALPKTVDLKVIETEPNLKGATATSSYKPAVLETGLSVRIPPFIEVGETIRIDTEKKEYLERVKK